MHLLRRSGKRFLLNKSHNVHFTGLTEFPLLSLLHFCQLEGEPAQKNIVNKSTRRFSVFVEDQIHIASLRNQYRECHSLYGYPVVFLSRHMHMSVYRKRECKGEDLEHGTLELGVTLLKSGACVDDSATASQAASQKAYRKISDVVEGEVGISSQKKQEICNYEDVLVAEALTISHRDGKKREQNNIDASELTAVNLLTEERKVKRFDGSGLEVVIRKYLSKATQGQIFNDSRLESSASNAKTLSQICRERLENEGFKPAVGSTDMVLQKEDKEMLVKDTSELCLNDTKTSCNERRQEGQGSDWSGFLQRDDASVKDKLSMSKHGPASSRHERTCFAVQKKKNKNKKKSWNINRQLGPEDLKQLSSAFSDEKTKTCGGRSLKHSHTWLPYHSMVLLDSTDLMSQNALKLEDTEEKRESVEVVFANGRQINQGITDEFVEQKQISLACEDPTKSRFDQDQKNIPGKVSQHRKPIQQYEEEKEEFIKNMSWEEDEVIKRQHREKIARKTLRQWQEGPSGWKKEAHSPLLLAEKQQAHPHAMSMNHIATHEVIDKVSTPPNHSIEKWQRSHTAMEPHMRKGLHTIETVEKGKEAANEAGSFFLQNRGKMTVYNHCKVGTLFDSSSKDWMNAQVETIEKRVDRDQWDHTGAQKVHYPLRNYKELFIILDLNGVLIKRWGENPSLPGVRKLNRKWIQLRPGCIEFLQKAFSFFRVGIWSTMTQKNVLSVCKLLEEQALQSLPFFMLWSKDSCYQLRGVQRPDKSHVIADFKPLSHVWGNWPSLGFHNTVLIDDSPYKACMNNPYNCIFPDAYEGCTDDRYLNDVLWPYLERMRMSQNIQAYIANNPLGQPPIVVGHELYCHVRQVIDVFDYLVKPTNKR